MDGVLSQEEIEALLNNTDTADDGGANEFTDTEKDAIGEIANISMGTAATTLFSLVNRKVEISTPVVTIATWDDLLQEYLDYCNNEITFDRTRFTSNFDKSQASD